MFDISNLKGIFHYQIADNYTKKDKEKIAFYEKKLSKAKVPLKIITSIKSSTCNKNFEKIITYANLKAFLEKFYMSLSPELLSDIETNQIELDLLNSLNKPPFSKEDYNDICNSLKELAILIIQNDIYNNILEDFNIE